MTGSCYGDIVLMFVSAEVSCKRICKYSMAMDLSAGARKAHPLDHIKRQNLNVNAIGSSRRRHLIAARATDNKQQGWSFPWSKPSRGESDSEYEYVYVTDSGAADDVVQQPAAPAAAVQQDVQQHHQQQQQQQASVPGQDAGLLEHKAGLQSVVEVVAAAGSAQVRCASLPSATRSQST
jgi:hypothetical protein